MVTIIKMSDGGGSTNLPTKRKIEEVSVEPHNSDEEIKIRRPTKKHRYFALMEKATKRQEDERSSKVPEDSAQNERLSAILKKLNQARSLPGVDLEVTTTTEATVEETVSLSQPVARLSERKHTFQGDFIPLTVVQPEIELLNDIDNPFSDTVDQASSIKVVYDRKDYDGPYDLASINRVRQYLFDEFRTKYIDRQTEILKMKMKIPSRFDEDSRLWRRIKQRTHEAKIKLEQAGRVFDRCESKLTGKATRQSSMDKSHLRFEEDDDDVQIIDPEAEEDEDDMDSSLENLLKDDSDDVLSLSSNNDDDDDSDSSDQDSKCVQFGKYSTNATKTNAKLKSSPSKGKKSIKSGVHSARGSNRRDPDRLDTKKSNKNGNKINQDDDDQIAQLKAKYKEIRNKRRRVKKSKTFDLKREALGIELKEIRNELKKLTRSKARRPVTRSSQPKVLETSLNLDTSRSSSSSNDSIKKKSDKSLFYISKKPLKNRRLRKILREGAAQNPKNPNSNKKAKRRQKAQEKKKMSNIKTNRQS